MAENSVQGSPAQKIPLNASQTRAVFADNLRLLLKGHPSVAQVCRQIGINRTQFNRYLSSEAFPRPDVLKLICDFFEVDARILLTPLKSERPATGMNGKKIITDSKFSEMANEAGMSKVDQTRLPQSFYAIYRRAVHSDEFVMMLIAKVIHNDNGRTTITSLMPRQMSEIMGLPMGIHKRRIYGPVLQHPIGVSYMMFVKNSPIIQFGFTEYSFLGNNRIHFGHSLMTHRMHAAKPITMPILMVQLDGGWPELVANVRRTGFVRRDSLPSNMARYLLTGED